MPDVVQPLLLGPELARRHRFRIAAATPRLAGAGWARACIPCPTRKMAAAEAVYAHTGLASGAAGRSLAAANLKFSWQYYARLVALLSTRRRRNLIGTIEPEHLDRLERALSMPHGLIILSAHLGDFEIGAAWLGQSTGREVVAVVDTVAPRARQAFFDRVRQSCGLILRRAESTSLPELKADLAAGRIVTLMIDRSPPLCRVPVLFLDRPAVAPRGPDLLARASGALVLSAATHTDPTGTRSVSFAGPYDAASLSPEQLMQGVSDDISEFVRRRPEQWHIPAELAQLPFAAVSHTVSGGWNL
jgi:lauroyl/myristoyl acyltransferase